MATAADIVTFLFYRFKMVGHLGNAPSQFIEHRIYSPSYVFNSIMTRKIIYNKL